MLAIVHGVLAQVVLAIMAVVAAVTSSRWRRGGLSIGSGRLATDRQLAVIFLVCLLIQLVLGAAYRHLGTELGTRAPAANHALLGHIVMAVLVVVLGVFVGLRGSSLEGRDRVFVWLGRTLLISIGLQILLGLGALAAVMMRPQAGTTADVPAWEVLLTSGHQANGALLLVLSLLLVAWYRRVPDDPVAAIA
jgi:heme A synthase